MVLMVPHIISAAPFSLAGGLSWVLWNIWVYYARARFLASQKYVLLEMRLPENIYKSPLAMEVVLDALHQTGGESTWYDRLIRGKVRPHFSLELVSLEGQVKFFLRTREGLRQIVENQIYSQYPDIEIYTVPDYTTRIRFGKEGSDWAVWASEFELSKPNVFPIKTYIDYGLNKESVEEEQKIDPITPMIEFLGSLGRGQQVWYQLIIRAGKGKDDKTGYWHYDLKDEVKKEIEEMTKPDPVNEGEIPKEKKLTSQDKRIIEALEKSLQKRWFDCGMRAVYLARKDVFNGTHVPAMLGVVKQYSSPDLNGFKPKNVTDVDYPWQDISQKKRAQMKESLFDAYRRRSWFFPPYERKPFVLNAEEIATIYHFPGGVAQTPTFGRVESKKAEPPINLPL